MKFQLIGLGSKMSPIEGGGYSSQPEGPWVIYKAFYEDGKKYGEFFLNINTITGEAEIKRKDVDYADDLLEAFELELSDKQEFLARHQGDNMTFSG